MATLVLTTVGTLVGGPIGGAIGAVLGQAADQAILAPKGRQGPRLGDLSVQTSSYGSVLPKLFGTTRVAGTVIWATDLIERSSTSGKGQGRQTTYSYSVSFAVALSARRIRAVRRIWADGNLLRGAAGDLKVPGTLRVHDGDEDQAVDPLIAAAEGVGQAPAFRGIAYAVFEDLALADYGNRIPSLTFEVEADEAAVSIGAIAAQLADVRGVETPVLRGFAASGDSVRGAIEDVALVHGLVMAQDADGLVLSSPVGPAMALAEADVLPGRERRFGPVAARTGEVAVTYHDVARDFQVGLQRARIGAPVPESRVERIALPAVLAAGEAKALAEGRLAALGSGRAEMDVRLTWRGAAALAPGRLVRLGGDGAVWRVRRWTLEPMAVRVGLVRHAGPAIAATADPGRATRQPDAVHGPTLLRLIELPGTGVAPVIAVMAAGAQPGWRRAMCSLSHDDGASWTEIGPTAAPAVIGICLTALPPGQSALLDEVAAIDVAVRHDAMVLLSCDDDALAAGANMARVGGEWIQFARAEAIGPALYRLSRLLRGRRGSEWAMTDHATGEPFVLADERAMRLPVPPDGAGIGARVRVTATGVGDAEPAEAVVTVVGEAVRPPAPVHGTWTPGEDGAIVLGWTRRSRQGWAWADGVDAPLGEEGEHYRLTIHAAGGPRIVEVGAPAWTYGAAERADDGPGPVAVDIVQLGTYAASRPCRIVVG